MTVRELNKTQLDELKVRYVLEQFKKKHACPPPDFCEYALHLTNQFIFDKYDGIDFVEDDFFCGKEE
jgi:hypothetical protein